MWINLTFLLLLFFWNMSITLTIWRCGVVVTTAVQLHSKKPKLRFCAGSNPACGVSEIRNGKDLWQWSRLEIRLNAFRRSTIPQRQFISSTLWFIYPLSTSDCLKGIVISGLCNKKDLQEKNRKLRVLFILVWQQNCICKWLVDKLFLFFQFHIY